MWQPRGVRTIAGVDGRRGGWALAIATVDDDLLVAVDWHIVPGQDALGVAEVFRRARQAGAAAVGVDAPLGLPATHWRPCDLLAKRRLGRASARVFLAPPRAVLAAGSYGEARVVARAMLAGRGVSAQAYGLRGIVLSLDDVLRTDPLARGLAVEVHPELSFMAMAGRAPGDPLPSKRTAAGRAAREAALARWAVPGLGLLAPAGDDHLDALAAAWSAVRFIARHAEVLGGEPDEVGLPMRIAV